MITSNILSGELEFSTSRSSGPGGQNVNKVNTKVTLRWNVKDSSLLTVEEKDLLLQKLSSRLTTEGVLLLSAQDKRSQLQNKEEALLKLDQLLKKAFAKRKKRKATKPSKSSVQSRLDKKKKHSDKKKSRQSRF
ncbi:MAG: aminoacyl-tRNA hydrolase [Bacteroidetes bacterium]|nr:aminoacyl-tRNA hydrolase [Bacteroidota bacterium]MBI3481763.1 aminoacyl-tRNA hydrolase [Bacteroidota bacterium]